MSVHNTIISPVAKGDFPSPRVRRMPYKSNLKELGEYLKVAPSGNKGMIKHLIELYSDKKIPNYKTVENVVTRLITKTKNTSIQAKGVKEYEKLQVSTVILCRRLAASSGRSLKNARGL